MTYPPPPPPPPGHYPPPPGAPGAPVQKTAKPGIAGGMMIGVAAIGLLGIAYSILDWFFNFGIGTSYGASNVGIFAAFILIISIICWAIVGILAIVTLIGGIMAIGRKNWVFALVGSICAILVGLCSGGPCCSCAILGTILAIVALIMVILSKKEFAK